MTDPLWWDGVSPRVTRPSLAGVSAHARTADVCIVGGGYTGLWTAYHLLQSDPSLDVLVVEAEHVGFGASGRNGGWASALYPVGPEAISGAHGTVAARNLVVALRDSVDDLGTLCAAEGIDAGFHKGGTVVVALGPAQLAQAHSEVAASDAWGLGLTWFDAPELASRLAVAGALGGTFQPHCARVHPYRLVRGLAAAVERHGGRIVERTRVARIDPGVVTLENGASVTARHVVRATEAWSSTLEGSRRAVAPVYSLVVATQPLPASVWDRVGLHDNETFSEHRHLVIYGQRSVDDRLVFGGRGATYHFRSSIRPEYDGVERVFEGLRAELRDLLPVLAEQDVQFTHAWGGPLGVPRDWHPSVSHDPVTRMGAAGRYVGDGVALSQLAGRVLAELVTGRRTPLSSLPFVGHRSPAWEREPLRWAGVNAGLRLATLADAEEARTGRPAMVGRLLSALTGH